MPLKTSSPFTILTATALAGIASAQEPQPARIEETVVIGKRADRLSEAPAASSGTASGEELRARPV
jgi:hypothetical protein